MISTNTHQSSGHDLIKACLFLFGVALFIRFPFFFRDYIDRDESTFILIGNSITDGHLPYDFLWDLKPPLLFYVFGFVEYLFPHSLIAIRFFGVLIVFISAVVLMQIVRTIGAKNGFIIALFYILFSSLFDSVQCVMSEHVSVFFFLPALLLFLKNKSPFYFFISGFLFGCALLCKLNLAYTLTALLIFCFFFYFKSDGVLTKIKNNFFLVSGLLIPFVVIAIPYFIQNKLKLFIDSVFMATLEYGHNTSITLLQKLSDSLWIILAGAIISFLALRFAKPGSKKTAGLFCTMLMATIFTFFSSGRVNAHYLIQAYPFIFILVFAFAIKHEFRPGYLKFAFLVLLVCIESYLEYYRIIKNFSENSTFYNGKSIIAINELKKRHLEDKVIFFGDYHIGYWFLHKYPLTRSVTHPTSLTRPQFFKYFGDNRNSLQELKYIMEDIKPEIVVSRRENLSFFANDSPENLYFDTLTRFYFSLIYKNPEEKIFIWQRK